jgi:hypothetical protein
MRSRRTQWAESWLTAVLLDVHAPGDLGKQLEVTVPQRPDELLDLLFPADLGHEVQEGIGDSLYGDTTITFSSSSEAMISPTLFMLAPSFSEDPPN